MVELIVLGAFALSLFVCVGLGVSILYALILGFVLFCGYGVYRGHSLREMLSLALSGIRTVKGILLTFPLIGVITALWRRSGRAYFRRGVRLPARITAALGAPWRRGNTVHGEGVFHRVHLLLLSGDARRHRAVGQGA